MEGNNKSAPASISTLSGSGPVLTAMVKIPADTPACTPKGSIFHHKAFPRLYTGFLQSHEVGLGVGLAVFHIKTGHHQVAPEYARKIMIQPVDEADLPRPGDDHGGEAIGLYLFQQLVSARHPWGFRTTAEHVGLGFIDGLLLSSSVARRPQSRYCQQVDGSAARTSFVHVGFFGRDMQAELRHGMAPGISMVGHGVEETPSISKSTALRRVAPKPCFKYLSFLLRTWAYLFKRARMASLSFS